MLGRMKFTLSFILGARDGLYAPAAVTELKSLFSFQDSFFSASSLSLFSRQFSISGMSRDMRKSLFSLFLAYSFRLFGFISDVNYLSLLYFSFFILVLTILSMFFLCSFTNFLSERQFSILYVLKDSWFKPAIWFYPISSVISSLDSGFEFSRIFIESEGKRGDTFVGKVQVDEVVFLQHFRHEGGFLRAKLL